MKNVHKTLEKYERITRSLGIVNIDTTTSALCVTNLRYAAIYHAANYNNQTKNPICIFW